MKKKILLLCMVLIFAMLTSACGNKSEETDINVDVTADTVVNVFAATTMAESLNIIINNFEKKNPGIDVITTYDFSENLKKQIQKGESCDIFISDSQEQMDAIDGNSPDCEKNNYILDGSRINLVENRCALVVSPEYIHKIQTWDDFETLIKEVSKKRDLEMIIGDSDTSLGQSSSKILKNMGVNEKKLKRKGIIKDEKDINKMIERISSGDVDCGIIFVTDAHSAGFMVKGVATSDLTGGQIFFPAAEMIGSSQKDAANKFFMYLKTMEAMEVFESVDLIRAIY